MPHFSTLSPRKHIVIQKTCPFQLTPDAFFHSGFCYTTSYPQTSPYSPHLVASVSIPLLCCVTSNRHITLRLLGFSRRYSRAPKFLAHRDLLVLILKAPPRLTSPARVNCSLALRHHIAKPCIRLPLILPPGSVLRPAFSEAFLGVLEY